MVYLSKISGSFFVAFFGLIVKEILILTGLEPQVRPQPLPFMYLTDIIIWSSLNILTQQTTKSQNFNEHNQRSIKWGQSGVLQVKHESFNFESIDNNLSHLLILIIQFFKFLSFGTNKIIFIIIEQKPVW